MLAEAQHAPQASLSSTPSSSRTLLQPNNDGSGTTTAMTDSTPQGHWLGHILARKHRERRPTRPKQGLQVWHNTPGQYIECTCKLTTTKATRQNNNISRYKYFRRATTSCKHLIIKHVTSLTLTWHECKQHGKHECIAG